MTAAPLMPRGGLRRLTRGEAALAAEVFGPALDTARVRLFAQPLSGFTRAFAAGGRLVVWPWRAALADFADPAAPLAGQAVFIHELTHVWQAQQGVNLLFAKLKCGDGPAAYAYSLGPGRAFADLNIEQQAMALEHAFLARRGGAAPYPAQAYAQVAPDWRRA